MKTIERNVHQLCNQIDDLKDQVEYWKSKYEQEVKERNEEINQRLEETRKGVANALMFALSVKDDANGNLVISNEDRKELAANWK